MVVRAVHRLPLRDVLSIGDGSQPLVSLLSSKKNLDELSPGIHLFMRYMYKIAHIPGKTLITADALSCSSRTTSDGGQVLLTDEVTAQANLVVGALPATE